MTKRKLKKRARPVPLAFEIPHHTELVATTPLPVPTWKQAITGADNATIDPTWLIVCFAVFVILPLAILILCALAAVDVYFNHHEAAVGALGGGIAAVVTSTAAFVGACAAILRQDRQPAPVQTTTTATATQTTVTTP